MMSAGIAGDVGLKVLEQVGGVVFSSLVERLRGRPRFSRDSAQYFSDQKVQLENQLKLSEDNLQSIISVAMNNNNMEHIDKIERIRARISNVRYDIEKTGANKYLEINPDADALRTLTILNLSLQFEIAVLQSSMRKTIDNVEDGEDIREDYRKIRDGVNSIEEIKGYLDRAYISPQASENAVRQLQQRKHVFSEVFGEFTEEAVNRADLILANVILARPDHFNKVEYIQHLSFMSSYYIEKLNLKEIDLEELKTAIEDENGQAKFSDDDMEKAARILIANDKRFILKTEGNKMSLAFSAKA